MLHIVLDGVRCVLQQLLSTAQRAGRQLHAALHAPVDASMEGAED